MHMHRLILVVALFAAFPTHAWAQNDDPFPAHRVMGNLFFVGTAGLGTFLITTPEGHILINTDFERTIPLIAGVPPITPPRSVRLADLAPLGEFDDRVGVLL